MEFGINLDVDGDFEKFIKIVHSVGIKKLRVFLSPDTDNKRVEEVAKILKKKMVRTYLSFYIAENTELFNKWDEKMDRLTKVLSYFSKRQIAGIGLPLEVHRVLRRGSSRRGIRKDAIVSNLNKMAQVIKKAGHKVVLQMRVDDIAGNLWSQVDHDIIDVEMFVSSKSTLHLDKLKLEKPLWFGKAGRFGGYIRPSMQKNVIKRIHSEAHGKCEIAFLWSDKKEGRFHWSKDQVFHLTGKELGTYNQGQMS